MNVLIAAAAVWLVALASGGIGANAQTRALPAPVPMSVPTPVQTTVPATEADAAVDQGEFEDARLKLSGRFEQGGSVLGQTMPGTSIRLDTRPVLVADDGQFVIAFDRDYPGTAKLYFSFPDGTQETKVFDIAPRDYDIQRIDGLPPSKVTPFTTQDLEKIRRDTAKKSAARADIAQGTWFAEDFMWPAKGIITGVFGSQRILNGEPKRPHFGVDVAADTGTPIVAPAGGKVTLAEADMFFEGGLIFLDHGHGYASTFMHMSRLDVQAGDMVERGQVLGAVGATGRATGPHLHWGLFWNGQRVDPAARVPPMPPADAARTDAN